jgi:hypothetical protein
MKISETMYALWDEYEYVIWGVGETQLAALEDAQQHSDPADINYRSSALRNSSCTQRLVQRVLEFGGNIEFTYTDGVLDLKE